MFLEGGKCYWYRDCRLVRVRCLVRVRYLVRVRGLVRVYNENL